MAGSPREMNPRARLFFATRMKKEAVGRDDKDVTDDVVGGVNIGAARNQRAAEGRAAREAEEARYAQSAADLSRMKKEAVGRDDKGRW